MSKAIVRVGFRDYAMDTDKAIQLVEMLSNTERYESKYRQGGDDKKGSYTHHIYTDDEESVANIKIITDDHYRMAKLAGKPE